LNRLVLLVRLSQTSPTSAASAAHKVASYLSLPLSKPLPKSSIIITGLRKTCTQSSIKEVFSAYGKIRRCAVASNKRGFALVEFVSGRSAEKVLEKVRRIGVYRLFTPTAAFF
jgi:RNA recognition motif-containing protein